MSRNIENVQGIQGNENSLMMIVRGCLFATGITLGLLFIYSLLLTFTKVPESTMNTCTTIIAGISILIGSSISTVKIKKMGIVNGGIVGLIYILILYLLSSVLQTGFTLNLASVLIMIFGILSGMLGGIIGVNMK